MSESMSKVFGFAHSPSTFTVQGRVFTLPAWRGGWVLWGPQTREVVWILMSAEGALFALTPSQACLPQRVFAAPLPPSPPRPCGPPPRPTGLARGARRAGLLGRFSAPFRLWGKSRKNPLRPEAPVACEDPLLLVHRELCNMLGAEPPVGWSGTGPAASWNRAEP